MLMLLGAPLLVGTAHAASLDNLEIGGPWGSPTATDGTAVWWNPAGVAAGHGTRFMLEGAPTFATINYDRPESEGGPPGGLDTVKLNGVIPFFGFATDAGVRGLGLGMGVSVPIARGGAEVDPPGSASYQLISGQIQAIYAQVAAGYNWNDRIAVGVAGALVHSGWTSTIDSDTLPDLDAAITALGQDSGYTDDLLENPDYGTRLSFGQLSDDRFAFSVGLRAQPVDMLAFGVAYVSGVRVENTGDVSIQFGCPPQSDAVGRFGMEAYGLCDAVVPADASVGYTLPGRVQAGLALFPLPALRIEAMGGYVGWGVFKDYAVAITNAQAATPEGTELVNQTRDWARDNHDSVWAALDAKGTLADDQIVLGGRVLYDMAAVPDAALSMNNYDANTVMLSGLLAARPARFLELGVSYTHQFIGTRTVTDSAFEMTLDTATRKEDRYFYPSANGTYSGSVNRLGVQARFAFGTAGSGAKKSPPREGADAEPLTGA